MKQRYRNCGAKRPLGPPASRWQDAGGLSPPHAGKLEALGLLDGIAALGHRTAEADPVQELVEGPEWSRFQLSLELKPLVRTETRAWVEQWLQHHPVVFDSERIRAGFIRAIVRDSGGIPAAVQGMLDLALIERTVTRETIHPLFNLGLEVPDRTRESLPRLLVRREGAGSQPKHVIRTRSQIS